MLIAITADPYPADTRFTAPLPGGGADLNLREVLMDVLCPVDEEARRSVAAGLDRRRNPDLPECHAALCLICDQWRAGLCLPSLRSGAGGQTPASADDPVAAHLSAAEDTAEATLELSIAVEYDPVGWACRQGYARDEEEVWDWLRAMALLYMVDRHETALPDPDGLEDDDPEQALLLGMRRRGALYWNEGVNISTLGREVIAANLAETERLIDDFDRYSDARWHRAKERGEFGSGHGADLRVPVMVEHGVDPLRAVFLLRLYDGSLDSWAGDWRAATDRETIRDLLLPVVDRRLPEPPSALLAAIIADGDDLAGA